LPIPGTNVSVVFLDTDGAPDDKVLLVDASNLGTKQKIEGTKNQRTYLSDNDIELIIKIFNEQLLVEDISVRVSFDEIAQKNFSFSAGQYFKVKIEYVEFSSEEFQEKMQGFQSDLRKFFDEGHQLEHDILSQLENLSYEEN
jgi:type I restriction enzyme M protein